MPKVTFIVEQGGKPHADSQQIMVDVKGIDPTGTQMMLDNAFDGKTFMGKIHEITLGLNRVPDAVWVTADVDEKYLDCYPYIGFTTLKSHEENGVTIIDECRLDRVSIGIMPNADPNIKTIREQMAMQ